MGPVFVATLQGALDEQTAKTRTVDEEIGMHFATIRESHALDVTIGAQHHIDDLALESGDTATLGVAAKIACVETRVEMVRVVERAFCESRIATRLVELAGATRDPRHRVFADVGTVAALAFTQPVLM